MKKTDNFQTSTGETVTISRAEYEKLQAQSKRISELESRVDVLMEALRLTRHKQFGASSEKSEDTLMEQLSFLFNEAEVFSAAKKEEASVTVVAAHKRHKKHEYTLDNIPEGMPTEQVEHRLEGEDLVCPQCGDTMTEIGKEVVRTLEIIPAQTVVREDIYHTYACPNCNKEDIETPVVKAPREKNIIPGSFATPEAIAHIMTQKFVMGSPLYRQEQELNRKGIHLSRQTMSNWLLRAAEDYLTPVYEQLHKEILTRDILHADETTLQVLHEPGKKPQSDSYMWLYRTSRDTDKPIVLYEYQPGRGAKHTLLEEENVLTVQELCEIAGVSRSGYYNWLKSEPERQDREAKDRADFELILAAYRHRGYDKGVRGIHMRLLHTGILMNVKKIRRLMRKFGLYCPIRKANPYRRMQKAIRTNNVAQNLVNQEFEKHGPRSILLTDITYIPLNDSYCYLSTILDACTKQVLSYVLSESFQVDFVLKTVEQMIENHGISLSEETIIHSDQGAQYTSIKFINLLKDSQLRQSMSRRGCCWDNAPQESFYGHMKDELADVIPSWQTFDDVKRSIDGWMDYYNNDRYQWDLAKLSPNEYYEYITTGVYPGPMIRKKSGSN